MHACVYTITQLYGHVHKGQVINACTYAKTRSHLLFFFFFFFFFFFKPYPLLPTSQSHHCFSLIISLHLQRKCSGWDIWNKFLETFEVRDSSVFGLQFQSWCGGGGSISTNGGSYRLDRPCKRWLELNEPALAQLGDPIKVGMAADGGDTKPVWELECLVRFRLPASVTDSWDDLTR